MRKISLLFILLISAACLVAQEVRPVKNVIVMIPDGTSVGVYSAARWYKFYNKMGDRLFIDPYFTGTVTTHSSNAPIGDSAPTSSTYATGILQKTGNVAIHPEADPGNDIYPVDASRTYQPAATVLEAAKMLKNKAVGLVFTCEFPHATPADFSAHHYNRGAYKFLAPQMAYQNMDVVFGGGNSILTDDIINHFKENGTRLIQNDRKALLDYDGEGKVWALFGDKALPYSMDRNPDQVPSIAEMTAKALELLSRKEEGFFLMVEGSQVDWAAHANDAVAMITEYLAFDEAVGEVMKFAEKDGNTAVVIMSDHGNSGLTIGSRSCPGYDKLSIEQLFGTVSNYKLSANGLEAILVNCKPDQIKAEFKKYTGIDITDEELQTLLSSKNYKESDYTKVGTSNNMAHNIVNIMNSRTCFGFTTGGHTGEETLLASYHPQGDILRGNVRNVEVNAYLQKLLGLDRPLQQLSDEIFARHTDVFTGEKIKVTVDKKDPDFPVLTVKKGKNRLEVKAFSSVAKLNGKPFDMGSVAVYIDKNDTFYLPKALAGKL
ncbi:MULTISPECIES: alkaline phosphatase [Petrimonas]|jgi:alkaline phosphatase|uniref:Alkaline phosphatase 3 n=1 Tax=Petrimonas mucosa TaxID=1642646 RepID=A0A1G4G4V8_9BACT|nr:MULTISPECIES: alkaline phosphatase [Petrimonas]MDD3561077.1 alkaline phosphatase [Petrimonas mucosa]SCM56041.1 Alkaline phosphatase 3 [Petrimonas mucosa]SFU54448.1 alkaline phosphatase [Porphyromonadaceae bacterium KHP3R9]HHT30881.1 alkaline phosphatase [Petrimonas mucosa]